MAIYNIKHTRKLKAWEFVLIVALAVLFAPITLILLPAIIRLKNYCPAKEYTPSKLPEEYHSKVKLIAHRGFRALAPENTLPAFEEAGKAKFWGAENDIHRTKDGVWVLMHDSYTYRMLSKNHKIERTDFATLQKANIDNGSNFRDYPNLKITPLEDYLKTCAKYDMKAIIELKGKLNTQHYGEITEMVKRYNVDATYISFEKEAILAMRKITDAPLYFIVYKITDEAISFAKSVPNCGIDFDGDDKKNQTKEAVGKIFEAGLEPCIWAIDDVSLVCHYADMGVQYITSNAVHY